MLVYWKFQCHEQFWLVHVVPPVVHDIQKCTKTLKVSFQTFLETHCTHDVEHAQQNKIHRKVQSDSTKIYERTRVISAVLISFWPDTGANLVPLCDFVQQENRQLVSPELRFTLWKTRKTLKYSQHPFLNVTPVELRSLLTDQFFLRGTMRFSHLATPWLLRPRVMHFRRLEIAWVYWPAVQFCLCQRLSLLLEQQNISGKRHHCLKLLPERTN